MILMRLRSGRGKGVGDLLRLAFMLITKVGLRAGLGLSHVRIGVDWLLLWSLLDVLLLGHLLVELLLLLLLGHLLVLLLQDTRVVRLLVLDGDWSNLVDGTGLPEARAWVKC